MKNFQMNFQEENKVKQLYLVPFSELYLECSYNWLQNPILLRLIDAKPVSRDTQRKWFDSIKNKPSYYIWGIACNEYHPVGVCGLKNVSSTEKSGELFCYIGDPNLWGGDLVIR